MKKIYHAILILLYSHIAEAQFQFVSPLPGSKNVSASHNIILREGSVLDPSSVKPSLFRIKGSKSGFHIFKLLLCDDGKTINLNPKDAFAFDETVTVSVSKGLITVNKMAVDDYSFSFTTHRMWTEEEQARIKNSKRLLEGEGWTPEDSAISGNDSLKISGMFTITANINPTPGVLFFDCRSAQTPPSSYNSIDVIDNNGDSVYQRTFSGYPYDFKIEKNGLLETYQGNIEKFLVMDSNFAVIDTYAAANGYLGDPHELQIMPNGYAFLIADEQQFMLLPDSVTTAEVVGSVIQEFDPDHNVVFEWRSFDHVGLDESEHVDFNLDLIDYIHTNSIEVDTDGNIIVSHRHLDQITKIDVSTGEFIWRLGGVKNEFTFINDTNRFSYQHDCRRLENGHITLFDNGNYHVPSKSYAREYQLDEVNKTATLVWSYSHPDINGIAVYSSAMGSVQRMPNGNTLIGWGHRVNTTLPSITEVDSMGNIVWELKMAATQNLIDYRVHKYDWNPCARPTFQFLNTQNITANSATLSWQGVANLSQQYEVQYKKHVDSIWITEDVGASQHSLDLANLNANTEYDWRIQSWCDTSSGDSSPFTEIVNFTTLLPTVIHSPRQSNVEIYPNPAETSVSISCDCNISGIRLLNILGQEVENVSLNQNGTESIHEFDISNIPTGNYFLEIMHNGRIEMEKLTVQ